VTVGRWISDIRGALSVPVGASLKCGAAT